MCFVMVVILVLPVSGHRGREGGWGVGGVKEGGGRWREWVKERMMEGERAVEERMEEVGRRGR